MVGYRAHDTISNREKLLAGATSGVLTRAVTQPLDVVKLRVQLQKAKKIQQKKHHPSVIRTTSKIYHEEGLKAFWHGHTVGQIHSIVAVSSQFHFFEIATAFCSQVLGIDENPRSTRTNFACGLFSGCASAVVVNPLEVLRVRQMVSSQYKGFINGFRVIYKKGGITAFSQGMSAALIQMGPTVALTFGVFSTLQPIILDELAVYGDDPEGAKNLVLASTVAGSAAGFVSKCVTYPFDLAKRRLQIAGHKGKRVTSTTKNLVKCYSLLDCMVNTVKKDGVRGLFNGLGVTLGKAQLTNIVMFTTYEMISFGFRNQS